MDSIIYTNNNYSAISVIANSAVDRRPFSPCFSLISHPFLLNHSLPPGNYRRRQITKSLRPPAAAAAAAVHGYSHTTNSKPSPMVQPMGRTYTVGNFMTGKDDLYVVKASTSVEEALETLAEKRITGFPVVDDEWKLVGVVSDYDLLALGSISGGTQADTNLFPDVDSTWKRFSEIQKLLGKTNGKVVGDLMTPSPLVIQESTNLEDAARLLLETKYRRLPVVDADGKLVGIITRGDVVRAALQIKHASWKTG